ncbi:MAG: hypothetical protein JWP29_4830, partial [Rhodoferax sp.]|nr:hypothetical protein [Rhodoferax sp.]
HTQIARALLTSANEDHHKAFNSFGIPSGLMEQTKRVLAQEALLRA